MKHIYTFFSLIFFISSAQLSAQNSTTGENLNKGLKQLEHLKDNSIVKNLPLKNIGPSVMSGRVTDFAVNPDDPTEFYVGYATGGLWHTINNGISFTPVMDNSPTQKIGDVAVDWKTGTIWVGTGEVNASRSSYAGIGLLKSEDKGKSWNFMGLPDSHHISRILINPDNPDEVIVGVTGHLYSPNPERGIFKTTNGGKTWDKKLFIGEYTGIIDIAVNPSNFSEMYAASWDKHREAWNFRESGKNSGIYKTTDAGDTWTLLSTKESGFPTGDGVGRIGLSVYDDNTIYAILDNQNHREKDETEKQAMGGLQKENFENMSTSKFLKLENEKLETFLRSNNFQKKYTAENVKEMVRSNKVKPSDLSLYLGSANSDLFDTPVIGAQVYRSDDGGKTWDLTHDDYLDDLYYSYGYYFGMIHVDPGNKDGIYIYGVPILKSKDAGKTFTSIDAENVHADHHALWINPKKPGHLIDGNDGGINISYDDGEHWSKNNSPSVGQFYTVNVDNENTYNIYGGLQDNGVWVGPHTNKESRRWNSSGDYNFESIMGGDGMQVEIDDRNSDIVYTGYQFGTYFRINRKSGEREYIQPRHELGERPYRFNWQTPILLSPHNQDILYMGANKLMRSMDQGNSWTPISEDLTKGAKEGDVPFGTLATISESPFQFGLIYTGSDDGLIYVSKNSGGSWTNISGNLPKDRWVSRIIASEFKKERVYATLNGYRNDDFKPYVYVSENYGETWQDISSNLPLSPVNVIREDPNNGNVLYLGTDDGLYVSLNRGQNWEVFSTGIPNVPVHDLRIQKREKDLVVGTHGRSIYIADIAAVSNLNNNELGEAISISSPEKVRFSSGWGNSYSKWMDPYVPEFTLTYYSAKKGKGMITIKSESGIEVQQIEVEADKGFNTAKYDLTIIEAAAEKLSKESKQLDIQQASNQKYYIPKGKYVMEFSINDKTAKSGFEVE
ncbi:sialidase family protein [Christiangramia sabulilitoris]|uniref:Glycosyl hydrolase n=1 Tax=Christiangramia sabulilitoris TaxID=2583991 RepID=A0A550I8E2_9FLAO|nr:sialidase family protein [Christiangramia sabulilitoris]TRO67237.1 glycosyl hydrolase [Christiangramia sabulilitoris]